MAVNDSGPRTVNSVSLQRLFLPFCDIYFAQSKVHSTLVHLVGFCVSFSQFFRYCQVAGACALPVIHSKALPSLLRFRRRQLIMSYIEPSSPGGMSSRRLTNRNTNRYSVTALFSMAAEQDVEVEDDLARGELLYLIAGSSTDKAH